MRPKWIATVLGTLVLAMAAAPACLAGEKEEKVTTITGKVSATFDAEWNTKSVKVTTDKNEVYNIVLDDKGGELAWEVGEKITVTGTLTIKEKEKWLKVTSFKVKEEGD